MKRFFGILFLVMMAFAGNANATNIAKSEVVLRALDKMTGRVSTLNAYVDDTIRFGTLWISIKACYTRPPEETPENSAFLDITEIKPGEDEMDVFRGWMFSSSPALSAMEHPVYDIWVLSCQGATVSGKIKSMDLE